MLILAIETSCDETACAVLEVKPRTVPPSGTGARVKGSARRPIFHVRASVVASQIKIHAPYGGVVPTLAAREHVKNLPLVFKKTVRQARVKLKDLDYIAVTQGPGLVIALLVGISFARGLGYALNKKIIPVNHIKGHIFSNWMLNSAVQFPVLNIVVSGGHTELILMKRLGSYALIGETRDDAAGEAFDKVAKMLTLGYPGGPAVSKLAARGDAKRFNLPRPMIASDNYDFSFSGLKTAVLYLLRKHPDIARNKKSLADLCASFEQAIVDVIVAKTLRAAKEYGAKTVALSGGVSANRRLRAELERAIAKKLPEARFLVPDTSLSTDNAAMIAVSAFFNHSSAVSWKHLDAIPNLSVV
ncbi:tRNA (adenosine(37)-N6)-threonylcarbamoyltransferase complex transferase subunit TsaD [Candidatus Azambacteria bacterium]|nr:tRNA (adenosine(37)-N6)-threonylcarbamoyltransferase complex transferase subunit TsaD [Candidatus Azambacteria bacterium]